MYIMLAINIKFGYANDHELFYFYNVVKCFNNVGRGKPCYTVNTRQRMHATSIHVVGMIKTLDD